MHTMALPAKGAGFVDQRVAFVAHKIGYAELQRQITAAQLRYDPDTAEKPDATIIIKPVRDLDEHIHVAGYEVPDRLVEQDALVDHHCVFPWCTRPARVCDCDHAVPYGEGGPTCSCNTAPLCRGHHRLKTHGGWTYDVLDRGAYLWHSPHGHTYRRDHTGTDPLTRRHRRRP